MPRIVLPGVVLTRGVLSGVILPRIALPLFVLPRVVLSGFVVLHLRAAIQRKDAQIVTLSIRDFGIRVGAEAILKVRIGNQRHRLLPTETVKGKASVLPENLPFICPGSNTVYAVFVLRGSDRGDGYAVRVRQNDPVFRDGQVPFPAGGIRDRVADGGECHR